MMAALKPCPLCGSDNVKADKHGVECRECGLWYGAGFNAVERWRKLRGDPNLPTEDGWIEEVWNHREG